MGGEAGCQGMEKVVGKGWQAWGGEIWELGSRSSRGEEGRGPGEGKEGKQSEAALGDTHSAPWLPSVSRRRHYRTPLLCHGNGAWRDMAAGVPPNSAPG